MTDIFLYPPESNENDIVLSDPTQPRAPYEQYTLFAETGVFNLVGSDAQLIHTPVPVPIPQPSVEESAGWYVEKKKQRKRVTLREYRLVTQSAKFNLRPGEISASVSRRLTTQSVEFLSTASPAILRYSAALRTTRGVNRLDVGEAQLLRSAVLYAVGGKLLVDGNLKGEVRKLLQAQPGVFGVSGNAAQLNKSLDTLLDDDLLFLLEMAA